MLLAASAAAAAQAPRGALPLALSLGGRSAAGRGGALQGLVGAAAVGGAGTALRGWPWGAAGLLGLPAGRLVAARAAAAGAASAMAGHAGPTPAWDATGGPAVQPPSAASARTGPRVVRGQLNEVIWSCWTGHNPVPAHLQLCLRTIERNSGLPVVLVTPANVAEYVPEPHPAYEHLHLQHRADYLRCCLLHAYGGIYLDMDTICLRDLRGLFKLLATYDAVGYDGSQWSELIGISDMGPFRPGTELTKLWFNVLHGKLQQRLEDIRSHQTDVFYWQEILRDVFVPVSLMHRAEISTALRAYNPEQEVLWSTKAFGDVLGDELQRAHVFILNNSKYGHELAHLTEEQLLGGPAVLSQLLRHALGLPHPA